MEPFDFEFCKPTWEPIVRQAAAQMSARGLPRPEGLDCGRYHLMRNRMGDAVCLRLYYRLTQTHRHIMIGRFFVAANSNVAKRSRPKGIRPGHIFSVDTGAHVRVVIDAQGLPRPEWLGY